MHLHPLRNLAAALAAFALGSAPAPAANLLINGDFAQAAPDGQPLNWKLDASGNIKMTVVPKAGRELGSNALQVVDKSNYGGSIGPLRQFVPLQPGREYAISCWNKGNAGGYLSFALGNKWGGRLWLRGGADWTWYEQEFTCNATEMAWPGAYEICLQVQDVCDALVADTRLEALNTLAEITVPYDPLARICVLPAAAFEPGRTTLPAGLPQLAPRLEGAPGQGLPKVATPFSAAAAVTLAYDDQGLILYAKIDDDKHFANPGADMWNGDCLQVAIDPDGNLNPDRDAKDVELGFSLYDGKPDNYCWTLNRALTPNELEYAVTPLKGGYFIAARIKWSFLKGVNVKGNGRFGVNLVLNDSDDGVNRRAAALAPGLYTYKDNQDSTLCLLKGKCAPVTLLPAAPVVSDYLRAKVIVVPATAGATLDYRLRATAANGTVVEISLPCDTAPRVGVPLAGTLKLKTADLPGGAIRLAVLNGAKVVATATIEKKDFYGKCRTRLATLKTQGAISLAKAKTLTAHTPRPRLDAATAIYERQVALLEKDLADTKQERMDYYGERGLRICDELAQLLTVIDTEIADAQAGRAAPANYQYRSSPKTLRHGYFEAAMAEAATGAKTERPVIFSGYGHFSGAVADIEWFPKIEANAIQFETGPDRFVTGERPDGSFIIAPEAAHDLSKVLTRAWASNVAVIFLLSPHYYPEWALTRHPEAAWNSGSFLRYDIQHPYSRKLLEAYLTALIPALRNSPGAGAVHSFCISNEPSYRPSLRSAFTRDRFIQYLKKRYGDDLARLNAAWNTHAASFAAAVPATDPTADTPAKGQYYDFCSFKADEFADWHSWLAATVKRLWPGVAVHCKELGGFGVDTAADFERFGKFSDLNGTDCGISYSPDTDDFARGDLFFSLMTSLKPVHIVNSETHLTPDLCDTPIAYAPVYTALFQQFAQGVAGSAIWVWEDTGFDLFKERHCFVGDIYRRPMAILAVRDASADANRLARELRDSFNVPAQVAILYSRPTLTLSPTADADTTAAYDALAGTGRKPGFLSENQLQAGQTGAVKLLIAADTAYVEPATAQALLRFAAAGGRIVAVGDCFKFDTNGHSLAVAVPAAARLDRALLQKPAELTTALVKVADAALGPLPVRMTAKAGSGAEWRCTAMPDGSCLVNLVTYGKTPVPVALAMPAGATAVDLISGQAFGPRFTLPTRQPLLLKVTPAVAPIPAPAAPPPPQKPARTWSLWPW